MQTVIKLIVRAFTQNIVLIQLSLTARKREISTFFDCQIQHIARLTLYSRGSVHVSSCDYSKRSFVQFEDIPILKLRDYQILQHTQQYNPINWRIWKKKKQINEYDAIVLIISAQGVDRFFRLLWALYEMTFPLQNSKLSRWHSSGVSYKSPN